MRAAGILGLGLWLMSVHATLAAPIDDADAARRRSDFATALQLYRPLAQTGSAQAQYGLGVLYTNGNGVPQDAAEGVRWYKLARSEEHTSELQSH